LFGVCDGHGSSGHNASAFIKDHLHEIVKKHANKKLEEKKEMLDEHDYIEIFGKAFEECD
jgi:serine/threonine protein phosphatase PrpC